MSVVGQVPRHQTLSLNDIPSAPDVGAARRRWPSLFLRVLSHGQVNVDKLKDEVEGRDLGATLST